MSIKLSSEPSSKASITKPFIVSTSLQKTCATQSKAIKSGCLLSTVIQDQRIGIRRQIKLYILNIQINLILVPRRNISSSGILPIRQCLYRSQFMESFMKQLQRGIRIYTDKYSSRLFFKSWHVFYLLAEVLVNSLIFLFIMISDRSYLVYLNIQIHSVNILTFLSVLPFSSMYFSRFLISSSSRFLFKKSLYMVMDCFMKAPRRELSKIVVYRIYRIILSSLKMLPMKFQNFIFLFIQSIILYSIHFLNHVLAYQTISILHG